MIKELDCKGHLMSAMLTSFEFFMCWAKAVKVAVSGVAIPETGTPG